MSLIKICLRLFGRIFLWLITLSYSALTTGATLYCHSATEVIPFTYSSLTMYFEGKICALRPNQNISYLRALRAWGGLPVQQAVSMHSVVDLVHASSVDLLPLSPELELIRESMLPDENVSATRLLCPFYHLMIQNLRQPLMQTENVVMVTDSLFELQPRFWINLSEQAPREIQYRVRSLLKESVKYCPTGTTENTSGKGSCASPTTNEVQDSMLDIFSSTSRQLLFTSNSLSDDPRQPGKKRHTQGSNCPLCNYSYCRESVFSEVEECFNIQADESEWEDAHQYNHGDVSDLINTDEKIESTIFQNEQTLPETTLCQQQQDNVEEDYPTNEVVRYRTEEIVYDRHYLHPENMHQSMPERRFITLREYLRRSDQEVSEAREITHSLSSNAIPAEKSDNIALSEPEKHNLMKPEAKEKNQAIDALEKEVCTSEYYKTEDYDSASAVMTVKVPDQQDIPIIEAEECVESEHLIYALDLVKSTQETHHDFDLPFHPDLFLFGEECEYRTNVEDDPLKGREELSRLLITWSSKVKVKLASMNETEFCLTYYALNEAGNLRVKLTDEDIESQIITARSNQLGTPVRVHNLILYRAELRTESWQCIAFRDGYGLLSFLEFNVSPYSLNEAFFIGQQYYSTYKLCDRFIFDYCKNEKVRGTDGHKHLDIKDAVGGNAELYFRLAVDVEDKAWLCAVFGTIIDSETCYQYVTQRRNNSALQRLQKTITAYNDLVWEGYVPTKKSFVSSARKIKWYWVHMTEIEEGHERYVPVALPYPDVKCSNAYARKGMIKQRPGKITAEFRFFPTARNGREVFLISQLVQNWMIYLFKQQKCRESILYTPYDPYQPSTKSDLLDKYRDFLIKIGLDPHDYQCLSRL